jgi:GT2 family glycosyltransferase
VTQANSANTWPIGVRLFNRPDYAEKLLASLQKQTIAIDPQHLHFIIDGYPGSLDEQRGKPDRTAQVADLVRAAFPQSHVAQCTSNLGIAEAAFRLQNQVFDLPHAHWGIFLEEDIVLEPDYLHGLHHMIALAQDLPEVVKVAANQINLNYLKNPPKPNRRNFFLGQGTQAFAERRDFFEARKHLTEIYLGVIGGRQYSDRDESEVFATMAEHGVFTIMGNNDVVHDRITMALKGLHIVSSQKLLTDIGIAGETSFAYPEIVLPDARTANLLITTQADLIEALGHLKAEAQLFEHKFFKDFWGGYLASVSGRLAFDVLVKKALRLFKR